MKIAALAAAGVLAATGTAMAGGPWTNESSQTLPFSGPLSPFDTTLSFDQFDDSDPLVELIGVCLEYDLTVTARVTAENDSTLPAPDFAVNLSGFADISIGSLSDTAAISTSAAQGVGPSDGTPDSGPDFHDFGLLSDNATGDDDQFFSGLGAFIGMGTIDAMVHAEAGFAVSGTTDSTIKTTNFMVEGTVTITYKYVPAGSTVGAFAAAGLVGMRRRRN